MSRSALSWLTTVAVLASFLQGCAANSSSIPAGTASGSAASGSTTHGSIRMPQEGLHVNCVDNPDDPSCSAGGCPVEYPDCGTPGTPYYDCCNDGGNGGGSNNNGIINPPQCPQSQNNTDRTNINLQVSVDDSTGTLSVTLHDAFGAGSYTFSIAGTFIENGSSQTFFSYPAGSGATSSAVTGNVTWSFPPPQDGSAWNSSSIQAWETNVSNPNDSIDSEIVQTTCHMAILQFRLPHVA